MASSCRNEMASKSFDNCWWVFCQVFDWLYGPNLCPIFVTSALPALKLFEYYPHVQDF